MFGKPIGVLFFEEVTSRQISGIGASRFSGGL